MPFVTFFFCIDDLAFDCGVETRSCTNKEPIVSIQDYNHYFQ